MLYPINWSLSNSNSQSTINYGKYYPLNEQKLRGGSEKPI